MVRDRALEAAEAYDELDQRELLMVAVMRLTELEKAVRFISLIVGIYFALAVIGAVLLFVGALASS